jgi:preprotein translocase SecE subunit
MYKWPDGRVIRTICFIVLAIIAVDLAYNGAYAPIFAYLNPTSTPVDGAAHAGVGGLVRGIVFAVAALITVVGGLAAVGFIPRTVDFLVGVEDEMTKVEWPHGSQLVRSTIIVAIILTVVALLVFAVDWLFITAIRTWIPKLGG